MVGRYWLEGETPLLPRLLMSPPPSHLCREVALRGVVEEVQPHLEILMQP
jgi:hypothetical protein